MGLNPAKTVTLFFVELRFFRHHLAPTQWAVGDRSPLEESPGRGLAARRIFLELLIKINEIFNENYRFFDIFDVFRIKLGFYSVLKSIYICWEVLIGGLGSIV